jgi:Pyruvate/2-oxoacid:ferredoxin oxidoreductase delta subunit
MSGMGKNPTADTLQSHENACSNCIKGVYYCPEGTRLKNKTIENISILKDIKDRELTKNAIKNH